MADITAVLVFVLVGVVTGELSLRLAPAHDEILPTLTRLVAVGIAVVAGAFWYSIQHADLAVSVLADICIVVGTLAFLRGGHYAIASAGSPRSDGSNL